MGFSWNGTHTSEHGIMAEARTLPIVPERKILTEELQGADGYVDFSSFNPLNRAAYRPRTWEFRCAFEERIKSNAAACIRAITTLFSSYTGLLIADECPGVQWNGIIMNRVDLTKVTAIFYTFGVIIQTQPFGAYVGPSDPNDPTVSIYEWGLL